MNDEICGGGVLGVLGMFVFLLLEDLIGIGGSGVIIIINNVMVYIYFGNLGDVDMMGG